MIMGGGCNITEMETRARWQQECQATITVCVSRDSEACWIAAAVRNPKKEFCFTSRFEARVQAGQA